MLTPIDIQNHVLKTTMGGYNRRETDDFIEAVQESYEACYKENHDLKEKISTLSEGLQYYKQMESTLQKALILAEKTSTETLEAAKTKAEEMEREAQENAEALLAESQESSQNILAEAEEKAALMENDAEEKSSFMMTNAQEKSQTLLADAQMNADNLLLQTKEKTAQMMTDVARELKDTTESIHRLKQNYEAYRAQYKNIVSSQLALLDNSDFQLNTSEIDTIIQEQNELIRSNDAAARNRTQVELPSEESSSFLFEEGVGIDEQIDSNEQNAVSDLEESSYSSEEDLYHLAEEAVSELTPSSEEAAVAEETGEGPLFGGSSYPGTSSYGATNQTETTEEAADGYQITSAGTETEDTYSLGSDVPGSADSTPFTFIDAE